MLRQMLKPIDVRGSIRCLEEYEDNMRIEFSTSARKALLTKKEQTQTHKKKRNLEKKGTDMLKMTCYHCQKLRHVTSHCKNVKQPRKPKKDRVVSVRVPAEEETNHVWPSRIVKNMKNCDYPARVTVEQF